MTFNHSSGWQYNAAVQSLDGYGESLLAALGTVRKSAEVGIIHFLIRKLIYFDESRLIVL